MLISFWTKASSRFHCKRRKRKKSIKDKILRMRFLQGLTRKSLILPRSTIFKSTWLSVWETALKYSHSQKRLIHANRLQLSCGKLLVIRLFLQKKYCTIFSESETSIKSQKAVSKNVDSTKCMRNTAIKWWRKQETSWQCKPSPKLRREN